MSGHDDSSRRETRDATPEKPNQPASVTTTDENIRAASRAMAGTRDALPPGTLPEQTPDSQGDQNMDPVVQPGRGAPTGA